MVANVGRWDSVLTLVVFFLTNAAVIFPFNIPLPFPECLILHLRGPLVRHRIITPSSNHDASHSTTHGISWIKLAANFQTVPLISVVFLLITTAIDRNVVRDGIVGVNGVQPLDILALFICLAYLTVSLDNTGLFRFLAFWVAKKGGSSLRKLYLYLYAFFVVSGVFLGNDPVVLSGTPFIAYFTQASGITQHAAWSFAQFTAANTASAVLPPSNQTNLVLTGAFAITFLSFAAYTVLPVLAVSVAVFLVFKMTFRLQQSDVVLLSSEGEFELSGQSTEAADVNEEETGPRLSSIALSTESVVLKDKSGAIIGSILLGVTLAVLVGTSTLRVPVWEITLPSALIMIARDIHYDYSKWRIFLKEYFFSAKKERRPVTGTSRQCTSDVIYPETLVDSSRIEASYSLICGPLDHDAMSTMSFFLNCSQKCAFPTVSTNLRRLPVALVPFALCMFVLVEGLVSKGWIDIFAGWWSAWMAFCERSGGDKALVVSAVYSMLAITVLLCNICGTNIGATILLARLLQIWFQTRDSLDERTRLGAIYALALGSNFGAYSFSFSASLAGLLWRDILRQKSIHVKQSQFALLNLPIVLTAVAVGGAILIAEIFVHTGP